MSDNNGAAVTATTPGVEASGAINVAPQTVQAVAGNAQTTQVVGNAQESWTNSITDKETKGWVELKGFKDVETMVGSYRNLEKTFGADKAGRTVLLPKGPDDKEGYNQLYEKIGRPKTADEYKIDGTGNEDFTKWAKNAMFEAGMSSKNAENFVKSFNEFTQKAIESQKINRDIKFKQEVQEVEREYGMALDSAKHKVDMVATHLGMDEKEIGALGEILGPKKSMSLFLNIAKNMGEDKFVDNTKDSVLTPDAADSKLSELMSDPDTYKAWVNAGHPRHAEVVRTVEDLQKQAGHFK